MLTADRRAGVGVIFILTIATLLVIVMIGIVLVVDDTKLLQLPTNKTTSMQQQGRRRLWLNFQDPSSISLKDSFGASDVQYHQNSQASALVSIVGPGGFVVKGTCDLASIKEHKETVHLGMFVKHGLHVTKNLLRNCPAVEQHVLVSTRRLPFIQWYPMLKWNRFTISKTNEHKMLAVRSPSSFYKSAFNHVCNKVTATKMKWRQKNHVNCTNPDEFDRIMKLQSAQRTGELNSWSNPFSLKNSIMKSKDIRTIMLVDYQCIPKVISNLCGNKLVDNTKVVSKSGNSAAEQGYIDYWSLQNYTQLPRDPFTQFWEEIYDVLAAECCLELVKED